MFNEIDKRITICTKCQQIPEIKINVRESKAYIKTICKCGNRYYDAVTFLALFTDELPSDSKAFKYKEKEIIFRNNKNIGIFNRNFYVNRDINHNITFHICYKHQTQSLIGYCNLCHDSFCSLCIKQHKKHPKKLIFTEGILMDEKELNKIKNNYKEIEDAVLNYLPQLENLLITNMKTENEKADMHSLASYCIYKNTILLSLIRIIINTFDKFPNTTPTIINNLRNNSDFNKTKY